MSFHELTPTGRHIEKTFQLFDIDILHENYSCTIDWGREMSNSHQAILERKGFEITKEKDFIYTLELDK